MKIRSAVFCWFLQRALIDITQLERCGAIRVEHREHLKNLSFNVKECKSVEIPALHLAPCLCGWSLCRLIGLRGCSWTSPKGSPGWTLWIGWFNDSRPDHWDRWQMVWWRLLSREETQNIDGLQRALRPGSGDCWCSAVRDSSSALYLLGQWSCSGFCEEASWWAARSCEKVSSDSCIASSQGRVRPLERWLTRRCIHRCLVGLSQRAKAFHFPARRSWQENPCWCWMFCVIWFAAQSHLPWAKFWLLFFCQSSRKFWLVQAGWLIVLMMDLHRDSQYCVIREVTKMFVPGTSLFC